MKITYLTKFRQDGDRVTSRKRHVLVHWTPTAQDVDTLLDQRHDDFKVLSVEPYSGPALMGAFVKSIHPEDAGGVQAFDALRLSYARL